MRPHLAPPVGTPSAGPPSRAGRLDPARLRGATRLAGSPRLARLLGSTAALWTAFLLVHAAIAVVGVVLVPEQAFWDLDLYRYWMWLGLYAGQWPVLSGPWVYPAGAVVPMLLAAVGGTGYGPGYATAWCVLVTALDAVALAVLVRRSRARSAPPTGAWWWVVFVALLGPIAVGRLDAVVAGPTVVALALALDRPRVAALLLAVGAWVKVAPGALLVPLLAVVRRPWRRVVLPAVLVTLVVVGAVTAGGGIADVASFLTEQGGRGLQMEAPGATPWLLVGLWSPAVRRIMDERIIAWEVVGPGTSAAAQVLSVLLVVGVAAAATLVLLVRRRLGDAWYTDRSARSELLVRGAMLLTLTLLVLNKVGSPQYMGWLAAPVAVALALGLPRWRTTACLVLGVAVATQVVFPWAYSEVVYAGPGITLLLAARNAVLVVLLVHTAVELLRPRPVGPEPAPDGTPIGEGRGDETPSAQTPTDETPTTHARADETPADEAR